MTGAGAAGAPEGGSASDPHVPAGDFGSWLHTTAAVVRHEREADVPCGDCTGCCTSSYFVHIGPDEADTLQRIPPALLFPAPGLADGHVLMGYDERGHCPMLVDGACTIYEHRPRTCREYDCRIFPASGLVPDGPTKVAIRRRTGQWRFRFPTSDDRVRHAAVQGAARFLVAHPECFTSGQAPQRHEDLALAAIHVHEVFLPAPTVEPDVATVRAALQS